MLLTNKNKLIFLIFLFIKFLFIIFLIPSIQELWFINFIKNYIHNPSLDPWSNYLLASGEPLGFPYGPIMFFIFLPITFIFWFLGNTIGMEDFFLGIGFRTNLLIFDLICFFVLSKLLDNKKREIIFFYWLSPLIFYVSYVYGQLDIIPTTITLIAYYFIYKNKFRTSGYFFGLALATKLSFALIIPFPIIYLWQNKRLSSGIKPFIKSLSAIIIIFVLTPIISSGYREMVLATPEKASLLWLNLSLTENLIIFVLPLTFFIIIYSMWRIKRSNFTLLTSITSLAFLISTLMMPPSPGWYLWALPFLIIYQIKTDINGKLLISLFTILPILIIFPNDQFSKIKILEKSFIYNTNLINNLNQNIIYTFFISLGVLISIRLFRETIQNNDYYKLNRKAFTIGITGGPSSGKNTLSRAIIDLLGNNSSIFIRENDYLKWSKSPKKSEYGKSLNINSNDLLKLNSDMELILDKNIIKRKAINNSLSSNQTVNYFDKDFMIVNGYHIFLPDTLNKLFNIRIFLEPEKELNLNWLKNKNNIAYKCELPGGISNISNYLDLYSQQKKLSDIIFSFSYINKDFLSYKTIKNLPLKIDVYLKDGIYAENLSKALISICGVKLNLNISNTNFSSKLSIEGDLWAEDIELVAKRLIPNLEEIIDSKPKWQSNIIGLMQLIILMQISYVFKYKINN